MNAYMATGDKREIKPPTLAARMYKTEEFKPEKQQTLSRWWIIFGATLVLFLGVGFLGHSYFFSAPNGEGGLEQFVASMGSGQGEIVQKLKEGGFFKSTLGFSLALHGARIEAGGYMISQSMSAWELARVLSERPFLRWVSIPEGLRKEEIADILNKTLSWEEGEKEKWITEYTTTSLDYIEGVYFPDTYLTPADEAPTKVAERLRAKFNEQFAPYAGETFRQNIRWQTLIRVASLVQREAAGESDMPLVAGIIWNRLLGKMKLQIDATLQYVRGNEKDGWWPKVRPEDKFIESPYNTYLHEGLPPYPIANPGLSAIKAALFPEETNCMYYLHDASGAIHCAKTYAEHEKNIEEFLR